MIARPWRLAVVGGGIVGLATARAILQARPDWQVTVFEKERACGQHQSTHNSGVLHCGLYYAPGSLKARLAVEGIRSMVEFCQHHCVPHEICGKIVLATNEVEMKRLWALEERGRANGLQGLRRLGPEEIREREPAARGVAALLVPQEGIVDYAKVIAALERDIRAQGGEIFTSRHVMKLLATQKGGWQVITAAGDFAADFIVNCAGLHCDRVARMAGELPATRIVPFRGEYYKLKANTGVRIHHLVYPVPDPAFPFLGVHFTRLIGGGVEAGPSAVLALAREGYRWSHCNVRDLAEVMTFPGLWRFLAKHPRMCALEVAQSLFKPLFVRALQKLVPAIQSGDLETGGSGVRAQAMERDGSLQQDFVVVRGKNALHVLNAPSPAATASLAIGGHICGLVTGHQGRC